MTQLVTPDHGVRRSRTVLLTLCLASFMATLDVLVVNVAIDDIGRDLGGHGLGADMDHRRSQVDRRSPGHQQPRLCRVRSAARDTR